MKKIYDTALPKLVMLLAAALITKIIVGIYNDLEAKHAFEALTEQLRISNEIAMESKVNKDVQ